MKKIQKLIKKMFFEGVYGIEKTIFMNLVLFYENTIPRGIS